MLLDMVFVVIISRINILAYPFNWIYLGVSPIMVVSVYIAGIRTLHSRVKKGCEYERQDSGC